MKAETMLNSSQPGGPRTPFKSEGMSGEEVAQSTEKAAKASKALAGMHPFPTEDASFYCWDASVCSWDAFVYRGSDASVGR
ncbi:hypothetical protein DICSQDRAFT_172264 [Dichomitus squalens LYAD-421 SS1]|uniref:Uncharacterized protein n=1 Tax=Dichomitus squalens (strain LYAD-421) TaxID=732165 RepID=R7SU63_DICSQ|nr:uncharacterized protein DICSQDRAFT_172264 [Dichomitus squalens LYAD-421 SS1]EJF59280.1 hypothetical protein DICSQDRAFT_172264 [Dichomitus squalens LYAD-421 SS1]